MTRKCRFIMLLDVDAKLTTREFALALPEIAARLEHTIYKLSQFTRPRLRRS